MKHQQIISVARNTATIRCLTCGCDQIVSRDEDGGAGIEQWQCGACENKLCGQCDEFVCPVCDGKFCPWHMVNTTTEGPMCEACSQIRLEDEEPECTCVCQADRADASGCEYHRHGGHYDSHAERTAMALSNEVEVPF